jgi:hypothetical protein
MEQTSPIDIIVLTCLSCLMKQTIVWVELTKDQRAYYKGIYENNIASLLKGNAGGNLPNLRNVVSAMDT